MWFLFLEIWVWLLAAFALGWVSHWLLCCREKDQSNEPAEQDSTRQEPVTESQPEDQ